MPALAFGILWAGYAVGLYGWAVIRGYLDESGKRIRFGELVNPVHPYSGPWGKSGGTFIDTLPSDPDFPGRHPASPPASGGGGGGGGSPPKAL